MSLTRGIVYNADYIYALISEKKKAVRYKTRYCIRFALLFIHTSFYINIIMIYDKIWKCFSSILFNFPYKIRYKYKKYPENQNYNYNSWPVSARIWQQKSRFCGSTVSHLRSLRQMTEYIWQKAIYNRNIRKTGKFRKQSCQIKVAIFWIWCYSNI